MREKHKKHEQKLSVVCGLSLNFIFISIFVFCKFPAVISMDFKGKKGHHFQKREGKDSASPGEGVCFWEGPSISPA